jgi:protoheme IX farnesyltransferase
MKHARAGTVSVPISTGRTLPRAADYLSLVKPRLNLLVVLSSGVGYYLGAPRGFDAQLMLEAILGTAFVAGGAATLNQVYERDTDALMRRTRLRPLPDGRISPNDARVFGLLLAACGLGTLAVRANALATVLAAVTLLVYLIVYTPMKRRSPLATLVGAVPGALPPLIGWTAGHGSISAGGAALFAIVFLWQIPHFMAIAWMYRDDYRAAGFPLLPVQEPDGRRAGRQAVLYAGALLAASVAPAGLDIEGWGYAVCALGLGTALVWLAARFAAIRSDQTARALFLGSIVYLPLLWTAMIVDKL